MAEFLIKAIDATHKDPDKDKAGCYKRGDVVVVMPDGWSWGREEALPKFVVVKIPGLSVESAKKYIGKHEEARIQTRRWDIDDWEKAKETGNYDEFISRPTVIKQGVDYVVLQGEIMTTITRRKHKLLLNELPQAIKDQIKDKGAATMIWEQFKNYIEDKTAQEI